MEKVSEKEVIKYFFDIVDGGDYKFVDNIFELISEGVIIYAKENHFCKETSEL